MRIDRYGAFTVNRVGVDGAGFPLSFMASRNTDVWMVEGTAMRCSDAAPLLASHGQTALVFNLGQTAFMDAARAPETLRGILDYQGVIGQIDNISWAVRNTSSELARLASADLPLLFDGWSLYDVDIVLLTAEPSVELVDALVLAVNTKRSGQGSLASLVGEPLAAYFNGHDDCYFHIEAPIEDMPARILSRLLASLVGASLIQRG